MHRGCNESEEGARHVATDEMAVRSWRPHTLDGACTEEREYENLYSMSGVCVLHRALPEPLDSKTVSNTVHFVLAGVIAELPEIV
jgi:hypothetical protein